MDECLDPSYELVSLLSDEEQRVASADDGSDGGGGGDGGDDDVGTGVVTAAARPSVVTSEPASLPPEAHPVAATVPATVGQQPFRSTSSERLLPPSAGRSSGRSAERSAERGVALAGASSSLSSACGGGNSSGRGGGGGRGIDKGDLGDLGFGGGGHGGSGGRGEHRDDGGGGCSGHGGSTGEVAKPALMSHVGHARVSLIVCPLWFAANWSYNQVTKTHTRNRRSRVQLQAKLPRENGDACAGGSEYSVSFFHSFVLYHVLPSNCVCARACVCVKSLSMTSVTSSTIISTTSALFSFVLSVAFAGEKYSLVKWQRHAQRGTRNDMRSGMCNGHLKARRMCFA